MLAIPAGLLLEERNLRKSDFKSRRVVMYAFNPEHSAGPGVAWFAYKNHELYVNVHHTGKAWFTENGDPNPVLALDGGYVQKQFIQDHTGVDVRSASPAPADVPDDLGREASAPDEPAANDSELNLAAKKLQHYLRTTQARIKDDDEWRKIWTERYWNRKGNRKTEGENPNNGKSLRWAARAVEELKLETEEEERRKQQEINDETERKLLESQNEERQKQEEQQRLDNERLKKEQEKLAQDAKNEQREREEQQAKNKASEEQKAQEKALAEGHKKLLQDQQRLQQDTQRLEQDTERKKLELKQSEEQIALQRKVLSDEAAENARVSRVRKSELDKQAADLLASNALLDKQAADLELKSQRIQREQEDNLRALATGRKALKDAADEAATAAEVTKKAHDDMQNLLDAEQQRQEAQKGSLAMEMAHLEQLWKRSQQVMDTDDDVVNKMDAAILSLQAKENVMKRWQDTQRIQEAEFQRRQAALQEAKKTLDELVAAARLPAAGVGSTAGADVDGDAHAAAAKIAALQQTVKLLNDINAAQKKLLDREKLNLAKKDREADELYKRLGGRPPPKADPVDPTAEFSFRQYLGAINYGDWIAAMDALCLFRDTDRSYVLFQTDWQTVLHENGLLLAKIAGRAVPFRTWELSRAFVDANQGSCRLIPFWNNLYFQFGLITERLTLENLRPWVEGERERLIGWCRTVCAGGQKRLYKDEADYDSRGAKDRRGYRAMYNCCHGPLRWFCYGHNDLHVDIRFLDKIMSAYLTEVIAMDDTSMIDMRVQEGHILSNVFAIENWHNDDAIAYAQALDDEIKQAEENYVTYDLSILQVSDDCRDTLQAISKWKWRVKQNAGAEAVYARIYEHARGQQTDDAPAAAMLWVQAVEHHRRYTLHQCPTGES